MKRLRNYFISGLLFWIPLGLSIILIKFFIELINNMVPSEYLPKTLFELSNIVPGFGIILIVIVVFITGILVNNFIGKKLLTLWEKILNQIPGFRSIYSALKQLSDTVLSPSNNNFKNVFLVQYPRLGMWTIAFQTGDYGGEVEEKIGEKIINLYIPTTPNPTSGFFILMPKKDLIKLEMSVDEAFKLIISTGVVVPKNKGKKQ